MVRSLTLEAATTEATVGDPVTVRVTDDFGRPIEGAVVTSESITAWTDERGRCQITFHTPGFRTLKAARSPGERVAYRSARATLRVVPEGRVPLARRIG
ncbi:hypothetical protein C490_08636 [Natronobacterium gregoryi SP2]|uniref:Carboxypeptidase regulatory-like domain-containing protein n=1 Tax=Natronobacterium gregoryi (strain ATCC 43098 / DSM 3393 / CCM 3738 / CIP 104747 / IAM 13177 / JCM 8860 / NBRC 102187 / NCIMB 2189 / SP2) TaxID=797304 RepID=L9Y4Q3_NATGS|nr:hypothetical protein C490_08636 [Natronobacterium gregoryi SP2]